jgi:polyketide synthase PksN
VLGSVKPNIGHADAAAGVASLIKATLAVSRATIPATLNFRSPNPEISLADSPFIVSPETTSWTSDTPRIAGVSAFGLGGNNAHVVLQEATAEPAAKTTRPRQVIALSARTEAELQALSSAFADHLRRRRNLSSEELADVAFTLTVGRRHFEYRWATCVSDLDELLAELVAPATPARPSLRWSLSLHGTYEQLAAMGRQLAAEEPLIRTAFAELDGGTVADPGSELQAAALSALVVVRVLSQLGLRFGRIDAPSWAHPAVEWLAGGADPARLGEILRTCRAADDPGDAREGAGRLLVGPAFDLAEAVGRAWSRGAPINWSRYFAGQERGRVQLPTYPFSRRRHWLPRAAPEMPEPTEPAGAAMAPAHQPTEVLRTVQTVWQAVLGLDAIDHEAHFADLGGDSMYAVEIGARLREILHVDLPLDLPYVTPTIASATRYIESMLTDGTIGGKPADDRCEHP